jgi:hypothetical protein
VWKNVSIAESNLTSLLFIPAGTPGKCRRPSPRLPELNGRRVRRVALRWILSDNVDGALPGMRIGAIFQPAVFLIFADGAGFLQHE